MRMDVDLLLEEWLNAASDQMAMRNTVLDNTQELMVFWVAL